MILCSDSSVFIQARFFENLQKPLDVDLDSPGWWRWRASETPLPKGVENPYLSLKRTSSPFFTLTECACGRTTTHTPDSWTPDSFNFPWLDLHTFDWSALTFKDIQGHSRNIQGTFKDIQGTFKGTLRFHLDTFIWFYVKERLWNIEQSDVIALNFILFSYSSIQSTYFQRTSWLHLFIVSVTSSLNPPLRT